MTDPVVPNYKTGVGRLVVDRFDFQNHIDGYAEPAKHLLRHKSNQIDLSASIDGYSWTTVQDALEALAALIAPPTLPDATASIKGVVQLAGDFGGTAASPRVVGLRGFPIASTPPSAGNVLAFNAGIWTPSAPAGAFTAGGDLTGSISSQQVVNLTGTAGNLTATCNTITFADGFAPTVTQTLSTADGSDTTIRAQGSSGTNKNSGNVIVSGGENTGVGLSGGVKLKMHDVGSNSYINMVQLAEAATGRRVLSLLHPTDLTTTNMPAGTGDRVIYIRDAATAPTAGAIPVGGSILFSSGGKVYVQQGSNGDQFALGSMPLLSVSGDVGQQIVVVRTFNQTTGASPAIAWAQAIATSTANMVEITVLGKQVASGNTYEASFRRSFVRNGAGAAVATFPLQAIGTTITPPAWTTPGTPVITSSWTDPNITLSGNNLVVLTGFNGGTTINWNIVVKITTCLAV